MISEKYKIFTSLSAFTEKGMGIFHDPKIPNIELHDLKSIANYYSIILNYGESTGALYGPLPVAYHTELLLYVYTFQIKNPEVQDQRLKDSIAPTFLLIFFPTSAETYTTKARDNIAQDISNWVTKFQTIQEITKDHINNLSSQIEQLIFKEQSHYELSEIEEATVVIGKSIELLHNVLKYNDKPIKLLISGTDELLLSLAKHSMFEKNSDLMSYYKFEDDRIEYRMNNIEGNIIITSIENPNLQKFLNNNLKGVIHFANFSTEQSIEAHTNELLKIIKHTSQNCIVSFVISQTDKPIKIGETKIPTILKEGIGRSISLIDLAQPKLTLATAIIEFLDKIIESVGKKG